VQLRELLLRQRINEAAKASLLACRKRPGQQGC
jgi:phage-related baseplate assembly protein